MALHHRLAARFASLAAVALLAACGGGESPGWTRPELVGAVTRLQGETVFVSDLQITDAGTMSFAWHALMPVPLEACASNCGPSVTVALPAPASAGPGKWGMFVRTGSGWQAISGLRSERADVWVVDNSGPKSLLYRESQPAGVRFDSVQRTASGWSAPTPLSAVLQNNHTDAISPDGRHARKAGQVWGENRFAISRANPEAGWQPFEYLDLPVSGGASLWGPPLVAVLDDGRAFLQAGKWWSAWRPATGWRPLEVSPEAGGFVSAGRDGHIYLASQRCDFGRCKAALTRYSFDTGWGETFVLDPEDSADQSGPSVCTGPGGHLLVTWHTGSGLGQRKSWSRTWNPGVGWGEKTRMPESIESFSAGRQNGACRIDARGSALFAGDGQLWRIDEGKWSFLSTLPASTRVVGIDSAGAVTALWLEEEPTLVRWFTSTYK